MGNYSTYSVQTQCSTINGYRIENIAIATT